jgi:hypothetical protein
MTGKVACECNVFPFISRDDICTRIDTDACNAMAILLDRFQLASHRGQTYPRIILTAS